MTPQEIEARYAELRAQKDAGQLPPEAFKQAVDELGYQASDGQWYHIDAATGGWLSWDGAQWVAVGTQSSDATQAAAQTATQAPAQTAAQTSALPQKFLPLLLMVLWLSIKNFFKRLPITILFIAGSVALYFWMIVVRQGGLSNPGSTFIERFLGVGARGYTSLTAGLSGAVILGVGSTLLCSFGMTLIRKGPGKAFRDLANMPREIRKHFKESGAFAWAGLASGAGVALVIGSLVSGYANVVMAVGIGGILASRAAPVISLMFRSFWQSTFGALQGSKAPQCPMGAGHVAMLGGSAGFLLRSILPKSLNNLNSALGKAPLTNIFADPAFLIGIFLLVLAGALAFQTSGRKMRPLPTSMILLLAVLFAIGPAGIVMAHNGGWSEARTNPNDSSWQQFITWLGSKGAGPALINVLLAGSGVAIGPALWAAILQALGQMGGGAAGTAVTGAGTGLTMPPLIDPETGEPLVVHDGESYQGGRRGQVWYNGRWVDYGDAQRRIEAWEAALERDRQRWYNERSNEWQNDLNRRRRDEGLDFDPHTDSWRKPPAPPPRFDVPQERGDVTAPDLTGKGNLWTMTPTNERLDQHLNDLDQTERSALDAYRDLDGQIDQARADGDTWRENWLRRHRDDLRRNINDIQGQKLDVTGRVNRREQQIDQYNRNLNNWTARDVAGEVASIPWHVARAAVAPDFSDVTETMQRAIDSRNQLQAELDAAPGLDRQYNEDLERLRNLRRQIAAARERGDTDAADRLLREAGPARDQLNQTIQRANRIHDIKNQWQRNAARANLAAYRAGGQMVLDGTGSVNTARTVNNVVDQWRRGNLPGQHRSSMTGGGTDAADSALPNRGPRLEGDDLNAHQQHMQGVQQGRSTVRDWMSRRLSGGTDAERAQAVKNCLEDYQSKVTLKDAPESVQRAFNDDVDRFRNQPLRQQIADDLNAQGCRVRDGNTTRPVRPDDFQPVSGQNSSSVGMDYDLAWRSRVVDADGNALRINHAQDVADGAARRLGFNPRAQEINMTGPTTGSTQAEAYRVPQGQTPGEYLGPNSVRRWDGTEGDLATRISDHKVNEAQIHHTPTNAQQEACRGSVKDYNRFTRPMLDGHPTARVPADLQEAVPILRQVGDGQISPAEGNALLRQRTGMDINEATRKLNSLQQTVPGLDRPGGMSDGG